jgi:hypothetical protein
MKEDKMGRNEIVIRRIACFCVALGWIPIAGRIAQAQDAQTRYARIAPIEQYMMDREAEIALARSAAPSSISAQAEVLVLAPKGYETAVKGENGFVCIVERSWANTSDAPEFWNPKHRSPNCFNQAAARTFLPIYIMKTDLVLEGKSKAEIVAATALALEKKELPALAPGAMAYMMSKQQYLNDEAKSWHPHLMFFVPGDAAKSWGANLPSSPIIAINDPEERVTIFLVLAAKWSDGTPGPSMMQ